MNLWLINHYANPPAVPGDARHWSHARELISRGHQVTVVCSSFHHLKHEQIKSTRDSRKVVRETIDGVPFVWIPGMSYQSGSFFRVAGFFEFAFRVWRGGWARSLPKPDLILGSSPHPFAALAAERLASRYGVPFLLELRDLWPHVLIEIGGYSTRHPFIQLVEWTMKFLYKRAARIIYFSRDSVDLLASMGADRRKMVWVPHGVDLKLAPKPEPPPDDRIFTVTYIGAHNQWNNLDTIVDAARHLHQKGVPGIEFRFVGDGVQKPILEARAQAEGLGNVYFEGAVPKNEIAAKLHRADAFILSNRVDAVSKGWMSFNKIYEYLAAQRPVVFASCTTANPVRESGAGILVEAGDHLQLAEAIEMLASQPGEQLAAYGLLGRRHIEEFYSIESIVSVFENMALEVSGYKSSVVSTVPMSFSY